ncbi:unnamed protein product, partial [Closterium sp. NIES-65]
MDVSSFDHDCLLLTASHCTAQKSVIPAVLHQRWRLLCSADRLAAGATSQLVRHGWMDVSSFDHDCLLLTASRCTAQKSVIPAALHQRWRLLCSADRLAAGATSQLVRHGWMDVSSFDHDCLLLTASHCTAQKSVIPAALHQRWRLLCSADRLAAGATSQLMFSSARGFLSCLPCPFLIKRLFSSFCRWRGMFILGALPPCLLLLGMAVAAPETPRWLLLHHSLHAAARAAVIVRGTEGAEEVLQELMSTHPLATSALTSAAADAPSSTALHLTRSCSAVEVPREHAAGAPSITALHSTRSSSAVEVLQKHGADATSSALHSPLLTSSRSAPPPAASLFHPRYRRVLLLGPTLFALQQFAGINAVVYFSSHVFRSAGFSSGIAASVLIASFKLAAVLLAARLVDSAGRKPLLLLSFLGMGCSMLFLSAVLSWPRLQPRAPLLSIIGTIT